MILEYLTIWITTIIAATGYFGIFLFMVAESMVLPVPSEAIMPFAGFLIAENKFSFFIFKVFNGFSMDFDFYFRF